MTDETVPLDDPSVPVWSFTARPIRVVDGDTLDLRFDLGFRTHRTARVRLADFDTAEIYGTPTDSAEYELGQEQSRFVREWLQEAETGRDWPLTVWTQKKTGKYGRYLAHIVRRSDGDSLSAALRRKYGDDSDD